MSSTAPNRGELAARQLQQLLSGSGAKMPDIAGPTPTVYGVYGPAYANTLQADQADPYNRVASQAALSMQAMGEQDAYEKELAATRDAQLQAQDTAGWYGLQDKALDKAPQGLAGQYSVGVDPSSHHYGIISDPALQATANANSLNNDYSDQFQKKAAGIKDMADAGYGFTPHDASQIVRNTLENPATAPQLQPYMTPKDTTDQYSANQGMTVPQQFSMQELKNAGMLEEAQASAAARDGKWTVSINPFLHPGQDGYQTFTFSGNPDMLRQQGLAPPTSTNPKAGDVAPASPATSGGVNFYMHPSSGEGMRSDPFTHQQKMHHGNDYAYPRGTPYPAEYDGTVVSVGPARGFGNHTTVVRYDNGLEVLYGHGEAANVQPGQRVKAGQALGLVGSEGRSTGPHVHRQVLHGPTEGAPKGAPVTRLAKIGGIIDRASQLGAKIEQQGTNIIITAPDGRRGVFDADGNKVG